MPYLTFSCFTFYLYFLDLACFCFLLTSYFVLTLLHSSGLVCFLYSCCAAYPVSILFRLVLFTDASHYFSLIVLFFSFTPSLSPWTLVSHVSGCLPWFLHCFLYQFLYLNLDNLMLQALKYFWPNFCFLRDVLLNGFLFLIFFICQSLVIYRSFAYRSLPLNK